ncbi:MAG TPA: transcription-repair coupling factor, partial [Synergistaceae bacterium]|nr:transcription-repair coupling factor [Synergistaceae bacterium]
YFFYPEGVPLSKEALDRLEALGEYSLFGGGARLAKRDLEIRGSGELLGIAQHGHIKKVGFQMCCNFLEKEVLALRSPEKRGELLCTIRLPLGLPGSYVPQTSLRVALYRRASRIANLEALEDFRKELRDRFGPFPKETERFLLSLELRIRAPLEGIQSIYCEADRTEAEGKNLERLFFSLPRWIFRRGGVCAEGPGGDPGLEELVKLLRMREENQAPSRAV